MTIPPRVYFYWSGEAFCFLNYLSVYSLLRKTPAATCEIHFRREPPPENRYWRLLRGTSGTTVREVDFPSLLQTCGMDGAEWTALSNGLSEAQASDVFRYLVLFVNGGVYADLDMIFVRDFTPLLCEEFLVGFQISSQHRNLINGAVLGAPARSPLIEMALQEAIQLLRNRQKLRWGDLGPDLLTKILVKDCFRNRALVRCAKLAHKLRVGRTLADEMVFRFLQKNHDIPIRHRNCFYYRSWLSGEWEQIFDDPSVPAEAFAIHLWHKFSADQMRAIDETNFRQTIRNPVLLTLCEDFVAARS